MNKKLNKKDLFCYFAILKTIQKLQNYKKSNKRLTQKRINRLTSYYKNLANLDMIGNNIECFFNKGQVKEKIITQNDKVCYVFNTGRSSYAKIIFPFSYDKFILIYNKLSEIINF